MVRRPPARFAPAVQSALLLAPLLALVALGAYFIRQDRKLVEAETRETAQLLADRALRRFLELATNAPADAFFSITNSWPDGAAFLRVDHDFNPLFPPPVEAAPEAPELSATQSNLWLQAEHAEFRTNGFAAAIRFLDEFLATNPDPAAQVRARFQRAVLEEKSGGDSWPALMENIARSAPIDARLDSGLPIAHAAGWKLLQGAAAPSEFVSAQISNLLAQPTEFTSYFLDQPSDEFAAARKLWVRHEHARSLKPVPGISRQADWIMFALETNVVARSESNLWELLAIAATQENIPDHFGWSIELAGQALGAGTKNELARVTAASNALHSVIALRNPQAVFQRQSERAWLFGSLLAISSATALLGVAHVVQSHRKQQRLAELKSNFVSSVSHELRAPLASMRLLAEGLHGGRVNDPEKRREYYHFLVQESRRLSTLVENVLDFSRIEQHRKTYDFAETDLRALLHAALNVVAPLAAERNIKLAFPAAPELIATIDALALQQAIVNLLDNAVKHSPPGQSVTLQLAAPDAAIEISVTDHGPGIPAGEHQRIFERFYRLGSELRRETQGVGIGLSIVQHTVEAHGGTVTVRSAPGQGATFVIGLPKGGPHA